MGGLVGFVETSQGFRLTSSKNIGDLREEVPHVGRGLG